MDCPPPQLDLDPTYGAMLIGLLFATFFQGVLTLQAYIYYERFPDDPKRLKALVALVWVFDVVHLVLIAQSCYHYLITNWGNVAALGFSTQELDLHLAIVGLATVVCQGFFLRRIWLFSKGNYLIVGFLGAGSLTTLGLDVSMSAQISKVPLVSSFANFTKEVISVFSIGAGIDIIMALLLVYYLRREKSEVRRTASVVATLIQYTVATGLATSLLAIACLIAYLIRPNTFIFIAMHFSLGRMYTNALLATLNSRQNLRERISQGVEFKKSSGWNNFSITRRRPNGMVSSDGGNTDVQLDSSSPYALKKLESRSLNINEGDSFHIGTESA